MKKLLILPVVLGLTACDKPNEVIQLKCTTHNVNKPYNDAVLKVYDNYVVISNAAGEKLRVPFNLYNTDADEYSNFEFYNPKIELRIGVEYNTIKYVVHKESGCYTVVPMGTHFDADCVGIKVSGQINQDYAVVSVDGGVDTRIPLATKTTVEDENVDHYLFKDSENGRALSVFTEIGTDKIYQIDIAEPHRHTTYNGCNVMIPLNQ